MLTILMVYRGGLLSKLLLARRATPLFHSLHGLLQLIVDGRFILLSKYDDNSWVEEFGMHRLTFPAQRYRRYVKVVKNVGSELNKVLHFILESAIAMRFDDSLPPVTTSMSAINRA